MILFPGATWESNGVISVGGGSWPTMGLVTPLLRLTESETLEGWCAELSCWTVPGAEMEALEHNYKPALA